VILLVLLQNQHQKHVSTLHSLSKVPSQQRMVVSFP